MAIIIDADVIIRGEKEQFDLEGWLAAHPDDRFEMAAITIAELWHGVERGIGSRRLKRQRYLEAIVNTMSIIPYTEATAYEHARIWADADSQGKMIGFYDLIVAATALERGSQIATFNKKHFSRVSGLRILEPA